MNSIKEKITMPLDDSFLQEEVRCEYTVSSRQKRIWAIEMDLLYQLLAVCKKHDIKVFAFAGTLLGAVRHRGFIPWDDDIDVCMTRPEFEKLRAIAATEFRHPYFLQTDLSDRRYFCQGYARLRNSLTTGHILAHESPDYNHGIYIDVFVMDGYVDGAAFKRQMQVKEALVSLVSLYRPKQQNNLLRRLYRSVMAHTFCKLVPYETVVGWYDKNLRKYSATAKRLTILTHPMYFITRYWCEAADLDETVYLPFENMTVPVPANYDKVLRNIYGDYMAFPPVEERGKWHSNDIYFDPDMAYTDYFKQKKDSWRK